MLKFFIKNFRAFLYSIFLCIGFYINIYIVESAPFAHFLIASFFLYIVLIMEIMSTWFWAKKKLRQYNIPIVDRYDRKTQLVLHATLPTVMYWATCLMIFSNMNPHFWIFLLIISFFSFYTLFVNIRAYYEDKFKLEEHTHYIYDFIKLLVFLYFIYGLYWFRYSENSNILLLSFAHFVISFLILLSNLLSYKYLQAKEIVYVSINSFIIALLSFFLMLTGTSNIFRSVILSFILFYISVGILHHKIKRDLSRNIIIEYFILGMLALSMTAGI